MQHQNNNSMDYYSVLGITSQASQADIRTAYRREALKWHPDKNRLPATATPEEVTRHQQRTEAKFRRVSEAYEVLGNESKRAMYDQTRSGRASSASMFHDPSFSQFHDPFDLFEQIFRDSNHFPHASFGGMMDPFAFGSAAPLNSRMGNSFFGPSSMFANQSAEFGAGRGMFEQDDDPMGFGMGSRGIRNGGNRFSSSSSSSFSYSSSGRGSTISSSSRTTIRNGVKETVKTRTDAQGNVTVETERVDRNGQVSRHITSQPAQALPDLPSSSLARSD